MENINQIHKKPELLLKQLIQFNTTNPPGNERACVEYIQYLLEAYGIETQTFALDENRPNLIARLKGTGTAPPLMLYGHVDVVTTENQSWTYTPFSGEIIDGYVWGRGALDMKGGVAMMVAAFLKAKAEGINLEGDILLVILSDEENGGDYGAKFLVEQHPELFKDVQYALGEFGGFTLYIGDKCFYPIMVAEKQICWTKLKIKGQGGHASMPVRNGTAAKLAKVLNRLQKRLPVHIIPEVKLMIEGVAKELPFSKRVILKQLLTPTLTDRILNMLGDNSKMFDSLLHHTATPTVIKASDKINVIPGEITVEIDGRVLPGFDAEEYIAELKKLIDDDFIEVELVRADISDSKPNMALFDSLAKILKELDPKAIPIPLVLPGVTDGRFFAQLGIQTYGFTPMNLPADLPLTAIVHAADERIPVEALYFGTNAIYSAMQGYGKK